VNIGGTQIGPGHAPYIIAEIGVNHDGDPQQALQLTDAAAQAGADAVKLQYFETDLLMSKAAKLAAYQKSAGETDPIAMLRRLELSINEMSRVVDRAHERGIHAIVTVFSTELVDQAEQLGWDAYKSASPDIIHKPLLDRLMQTGQPMIVSTGASTLDEVLRAVGWLDDALNRLALLQCVSCYPAEDPALGGIRVLNTITRLVTGYSDHTSSVAMGRDAVSAGALVLEKHLTYDRSAAGPDHHVSLDAARFREYVELARSGFSARTSVEQIPADLAHEKVVLGCERDVRSVSRQSVVAMMDLAPGVTIRADHLTCKRPGSGIEPFRMPELVGRQIEKHVEADMPLSDEDFAPVGVP